METRLCRKLQVIRTLTVKVITECPPPTSVHVGTDYLIKTHNRYLFLLQIEHCQLGCTEHIVKESGISTFLLQVDALSLQPDCLGLNPDSLTHQLCDLG